MNEIDVENILDELVQFAQCDTCNCSKCHNPHKPVTRQCFMEHPGWVNISPHNIQRILRKYKIGGEK